MSLTLMEPITHDLEGQYEFRKEAAEQVRDQLHQHLVEMSEMCSQVRSAFDDDEGGEGELQALYAELLDVLEQHHGMISEQLSDLSPFEELLDSECETVACSQ